MIQIDKVIINKLGLHARAAAKLIHCANQFSSKIQLTSSEKSADAKSILALMTLAASQGTPISISAEGDDEQHAIIAISNLIDDYFGEGE